MQLEEVDRQIQEQKSLLEVQEELLGVRVQIHPDRSLLLAIDMPDQHQVVISLDPNWECNSSSPFLVLHISQPVDIKEELDFLKGH